jgi:maleate isomerase
MLAASRGLARIGVLVPFTNTNLEPDLTVLNPTGVSFHFTRMGGYDVDKIPDEKQMLGMGEAPLDEPLRLLAGVKPDVILYACTSATLTHGLEFDRKLETQIQTMTGASSVTAAGALVYCLSALKVKKIGFASPYVAKINDQAISLLSDAGFETVSRAEVHEALDNYGQGNLKPDAVYELGLEADSAEAEAIVLSCTDMRSVEVVNRLEDTLGKPVVTSNQAMMFNALQILEIDHTRLDCGALMSISSR